MRKRRKLRATGSSKRQKVRTECTVDRISNLPAGVAHKILSLLTLIDLARFGSLSKTCRALYLSTPRLNFILPEHTSTRNEWSRFFNSVDRFFSLRGYNKIIHFRIHWSHRPLFCANPCACDDVRIRILPWLSNALRCKVEDIYIDISKVYFEGTFKFPTSIFLCRSLRTLSVSKGYVTIKTPPLACSSNLQCLKLAHVTLDQGFYKWISSSCQCIKVLHLQNVHGEMDITIQSASLKSFSIDTDNSNLRHFQISGEKLEDIHMYVSTFHCRSLNIFAPNLKNLEMIGYPISNQLGRFLHLEKADIWMWPGVDEGNDSGKVFDVLRSIHRVKDLTLHYETIMALFKDGSISVPPLLDDVSYLRINIGGLFDDLVLALVSLLRRMPNLSTLYLNSSWHCDFHRKIECSGYNMKYWKSQNLPFIPLLNEVTVELSRKSYGSNPVNFSRFILEHAPNLKKMVVIHSPQFAKSSLDKLMKSKEISNGEVVFRIK